MPPVRRALEFLLGGAGGAGLDRIHVRNGVLSYPETDGQPSWVAPQFGIATIVMLEGARRVADGDDPSTGRDLAVGAAWFVGSYVASGRLDRRHARTLAVAFALCAAARIARRPDRRRVLPYALLLTAAGTAYEHFLAGTGAFSYTRPELGNVPAWLPGLYLQGAPVAIDLVRLANVNLPARGR
jgi:hypothetical protein